MKSNTIGVVGRIPSRERSLRLHIRRGGRIPRREKSLRLHWMGKTVATS